MCCFGNQPAFYELNTPLEFSRSLDGCYSIGIEHGTGGKI
jgi:hypothetical protein